MNQCRRPGCGQPIPDERLHGRQGHPYATCSPTCEDELKRIGNRERQRRWYENNRAKKIAETTERNRKKRRSKK